MKKYACLIFFIFLICSNYSWGISDQSGFYEIEPTQYYFHNGSYLSQLHYTSSTARMWFTFIKADTDEENKPLFIFFNGGPGSGTTCGLMGFYTGRKTLDNRVIGGGDLYIDNPWSWTKLGNLLYIDARCTGFSYGLFDNGIERNENNIDEEFSGRNFNSYIDAADYIRVILKFLRDRPEIQKNPIIIVGESYGGVRSTLMLNMLLFYKQHSNGSDIYQDERLTQQIQEHYNVVFPQYMDQEVPPQIISTQFSNQILIQPAIDYYREAEEGRLLEQEDSIIYQVAQETGTVFTPCSSSNCDKKSNIYDFIEYTAYRDVYGCHKPAGWTDSFFNKGGELMQNPEQFAALTGTSISDIPELYSSARQNAYKFHFYSPTLYENFSIPFKMDQRFRSLSLEKQWLIKNREKYFSLFHLNNPLSQLTDIFGILNNWDAFYNSLSSDAFITYFYYNAGIIRQYPYYSYHPLTGMRFLKNLIYIKTFITNAKWDLVVYTNALPIAFRHHTDIVEESIHYENMPLHADRPGEIGITYIPGALGIPNIGTRIIRFPFYTKSAHPVSLTEPEEFYNDVKTWLFEN